MARTTAPLLSLDASGSIGSAFTFSRWKGRSYVRALVIPANPKTALQTGIRAAMRFHSQRWNPFTAAQKLEWENEVGNRAISGFNVYVGFNQDRIRRDLGSRRLPSDTVADTPGAPTTPAATAGVRQVTLTWVNALTGTVSATFIHRSLTGTFTPSPANLVAIVLAASLSFVDTNVDTGVEYFYELRHSDHSGSLGAGSTEVSATPT